MGEEERAGALNRGDGGSSAGAGALGTPAFDAGSIRSARPAVPLKRADGRPSLLAWALVALVAGMAGGLLGILAINSLNRGDASETAASRPADASNAGDAGAKDAAGGAQGAAQPTPDASGGAAVANAGQPGANAADGAGADNAADGAAAGGAQGADGAGTVAADGAPGGDDAAQLRGALAEWIAATNARDIDRQMQFYEARLGVFYLSRDTSRAAVRAEKANAFARAESVEVRADAPQIEIAHDGRTAVMRFRKQYAIGQRRGAVLQELRWRRTPAGWRIVGERDLREIR